MPVDIVEESDSLVALMAVDPSSISINYTEGENKWKATLNAQIEQLKAASEFRYEGKWKR
jgi:cyclopropane fatty-acyl-phospholipid synthase-like methyltransferase